MDYRVYKGKTGKFGAIQFSAPTSADNDKNKPGVIFINIANALAPDSYDWKNKIIMALNLTDLSAILHFFVTAGSGASLSLYHDPDKGKSNEGTRAKQLNIFTKDGVLGGMMITCSQKMDNGTITCKVPLSGPEVICLKTLLEWALPRMLNWGY
jgi:hypothetical protein